MCLCTYVCACTYAQFMCMVCTHSCIFTPWCARVHVCMCAQVYSSMCTRVAHVLWLSLRQSLVIIFSLVCHRWPHIVRKHGSRPNVLPMNWTFSQLFQHLPVYSSILCFLLVSLANNMCYHIRRNLLEGRVCVRLSQSLAHSGC